MKNLAIIPARSGSKGLKNKNIKLLNGKPLLTYTIKAAEESGLFDEIMVSTDSDEYAKIAKQWGANVPFLRSEELSNDTASSWDVVKVVIERYKDSGIEFDTVALLQPTSPLRTSNDIIEGYKALKEKTANLVVGVCEMDHSPLWANTLPENHSMENFIKPEVVLMPRQSIPTYYRINGALYIVRIEYLMNSSNIYADKSFATVMSKENSVDIDDQMDFVFAETLLQYRNSLEW
ncbi:MAG: acylneuraminate cytidylyltransferase [Anaerosolibacter sp.]|jgi:CMP-N,N'-diacetyllegionaminic acid synthase|uniref:acylneuraminate cytidylyltransferase family protein n=1 Tax=Anaerosolibacter sp. TaxID=1872527 RepID=UPI00261DF590|nr:acylneuraminate cytidylyltransferase family protein [Anaerosolibacter sp.]MDF2545703.1 acylneuraminate cytidylyltransferase [Anaerosolibacter sp.]